MSRLIWSFLLQTMLELKTHKTPSKCQSLSVHRNIAIHTRSPQAYLVASSRLAASSNHTTITCTHTHTTKHRTTKITDDFQVTSSGIDVLVLSHCCFAAVTFLRMTASFHASPPQRHLWLYIFHLSFPDLYFPHQRYPSLFLDLDPLDCLFGLKPPTLPPWLPVRNGCVRNQPAWIADWYEKKNVQKFYPPFLYRSFHSHSQIAILTTTNHLQS